MKSLRELLDALGSTDDDAAADDRRMSAMPGCTPIGSVAPRCAVRVAGVIAEVTQSPAQEPPRCDIVVGDGTGTLEARFLGRREIPGVSPGRVIVISGQCSLAAGSLLAVNPSYELVSATAQ